MVESAGKTKRMRKTMRIKGCLVAGVILFVSLISLFFLFGFSNRLFYLQMCGLFGKWETLFQGEAESLRDCLGPPFVLLFFFSLNYCRYILTCNTPT